MAADQSPTLRRRRLGIELRQLRDDADLTLEAAAHELEWSGTKLSRIENARVAVLPRDVRDLLDLYGVVDPTRREGLLALTRESRQKPWWHDVSEREDLPTGLEAYIAFETEASVLDLYGLAVVPGLLQTESYARAYIAATWVLDSNLKRIDDLVNLRLRRQARLTGGRPLEICVVLDEAVLHRNVGGPEVLCDQLRHLSELTDLSNVTIHVLPFSANADTPAMYGQFSIMHFTALEPPTILFLESPRGGLLVERAEDIELYVRCFDLLRKTALDPMRSRDLILQAAKSFR